MFDLLLLPLVAGLPAWLQWAAWKGGKQDGRRQAYGVGRRHGRRR